MNTCFCPRDCPDRHMGCHATCEGYKERAAAGGEQRENIKKARASRMEPISFLAEGSHKRKKTARVSK